MKAYFKRLYEEFKVGSLERKLYFIVALIGLLPVIFSVFAFEAYTEGSDSKPVVITMVLNATILWTFILMVLL